MRANALWFARMLLSIRPDLCIFSHDRASYTHFQTSHA